MPPGMSVLGHRSPVAARLQLLAAAVLFSSGGAAIKSCGLDGLAVVGARSAVAALALLCFVPRARQGWSRTIIPVGIGYALTMLFFVTANKLTSAASAVFLQSTAPMYVMLASPWVLKESITRRDVIIMGAFALGLLVFLVGARPPIESAPRPLAGNVLAAFAGVTWAGIIMGLRYLSRPGATEPNAAPSAVALGNVIACVFCIPSAGALVEAPPRDWMILLYLGLFQVTAAYLLLMRAVQRVSAFEASLLLLLEPILSPIWAWALNGETVAGMTFLGGGIILAASVAQVARPRKPTPLPRVSLAPGVFASLRRRRRAYARAHPEIEPGREAAGDPLEKRDHG